MTEKKEAANSIEATDAEDWREERKSELVTVTRGQLDEIMRDLYSIHTIGSFLDFTVLNPGAGERVAIAELHESDERCEPISNMARLIKEKAAMVMDSIGMIERGETIGHKEQEAQA